MWRFKTHTIVIDMIAENPNIHFNRLASKLRRVISRNILARVIRELKDLGVIVESRDKRHSQKILLRVSENFQEMRQKISLNNTLKGNVSESIRHVVKNYLSTVSRYSGELELEYTKYRLLKLILNLLPF